MQVTQIMEAESAEADVLPIGLRLALDEFVDVGAGFPCRAMLGVIGGLENRFDDLRKPARQVEVLLASVMPEQIPATGIHGQGNQKLEAAAPGDVDGAQLLALADHG